MRRSTRILLTGCAAAGLTAAILVPLPALDGAPRDAAREAALDREATAFFDEIRAGRGLARGWPDMPRPADAVSGAAAVELGRLLFFDPVLSGGDDVSCAHCHHPDLGFSDGRATSSGTGGDGVGPARTGGTPLRRNSPTLWNAGYQRLQFWDGRAADLEEQAAAPITHPDEMSQDPDELVAELAAIDDYRARFAAVFAGDPDGPEPGGTPVTFRRVQRALAAFERTLTSTDAPFDRHRAGDPDALSPAAKRGLALFRSARTRCFECHDLPSFADAGFTVIGVPDPTDGEPDRGRAEVVGPRLARAFKAPSLRNVARTAPYMHNGAHATLAQVLDFYTQGGGRGVVTDATIDDRVFPIRLSAAERADLIAFLEALTDESRRPEIPVAVPSGLPVVPRVATTAPMPEFGGATDPDREAAASAPPRIDGVLTVAPGASIQAAIDAARPGDTIRVAAGFYSQTLRVDTPDLRIVGPEDGTARLDGLGRFDEAVTASASGLLLRGFTLHGYRAAGVVLHRATDVRLERLAIEEPGRFGVHVHECDRVRIEDCTISGAYDVGALLTRSRDVVLARSELRANGAGAVVDSSRGFRIEDNDVTRNRRGVVALLRPDHPAKVCERGVIAGNRVLDNSRSSGGDPLSVVAWAPAGAGVALLGADACEVRDNEIRGNPGVGVLIAALPDADSGGPLDVDPWPDGNRISDNRLAGNGAAPAPADLAAGRGGVDLAWDGAGRGNTFAIDESATTRAPTVLAAPSWSPLRRRAAERVHRAWRWIREPPAAAAPEAGGSP